MNLDCKLKIGKLDRKITFQNHSETRDDYGGVATTWADELTTWANINYKVAIEGDTNDRETGWNSVVFTIRQRDGFSPTEKKRIVYDAEIYDITGIQEVGETRKRFWMIKARKNDTDSPN